MIGRAERRWNWRTWNLLLQIKEATDGEDRRQLSGEMTERGLCVSSGKPAMRALHSRKWVECIGSGEVHRRDYSNDLVYLPEWQVTPLGRAALAAAVVGGITVR